MKAFIVLALCAAATAQYGQPAIRVESNSYSAPMIRTESYGGYGQQMRQEIPITRFSHDIRGSQSDSLSYETGNGIHVTDNTQVVQGRGGSYDDGYGKMVQSDSVLHKQGSYAYTSPEGEHIQTTWTADENGFHADGAHLPRPVEMPAEHAEAHRLALSRASSYGSYDAPQRSSYDAPMRSSYDAPAIRVQSYDAPAIRSSYDAPAIRSSYDAPAIRSSY